MRLKADYHLGHELGGLVLQFFWPSKLKAEPGVLTRFGRVLHWIGTGLSVLLLGGAVITWGVSVNQFVINAGYWSTYSGTYRVYWPDSLLGGVAFVGAAVVLYLLSRALRYILSGE
jgi:hypothetical protein